AVGVDEAEQEQKYQVVARGRHAQPVGIGRALKDARERDRVHAQEKKRGGQIELARALVLEAQAGQNIHDGVEEDDGRTDQLQIEEGVSDPGRPGLGGLVGSVSLLARDAKTQPTGRAETVRYSRGSWRPFRAAATAATSRSCSRPRSIRRSF